MYEANIGFLRQMIRSLASFRKLALAEGVSYLLLAITMPLKYGLGWKAPNYVVGMIHGVLFITYGISVLGFLVRKEKSFKWAFLTMMASLLPFGTFIADKPLFQAKGN